MFCGPDRISSCSPRAVTFRSIAFYNEIKQSFEGKEKRRESFWAAPEVNAARRCISCSVELHASAAEGVPVCKGGPALPAL